MRALRVECVFALLIIYASFIFTFYFGLIVVNLREVKKWCERKVM